MARTILSLGSNLGDRANTLNRAVLELGKIGKIERESGIYETQPWGNINQPWFLNKVIEIETELQPEKLLAAIQKIERELGRVLKTNNGVYLPRKIDIDILFYDDLILKTNGLEIPHPYIADRRFALKPLAEIAPDFVHPLAKKDIRNLLNECKDASIVRPL